MASDGYASGAAGETKPLVIVTGATSGIGAKVAIDFSAKGHPLLLIGRRVEKMTELGLPNCLCEQCDVTNLAAFEAAVKKAEGQFGPAGCIVNNAGMMLLSEHVDTQDPADWTKMIQVNMVGVLNGIKCVVEGMRARKDGHVFNISSVCGSKIFANHTAYCGTKYAVNAITDGLRQECSQDGVKVTLISPGTVETELLTHNADYVLNAMTEWKKSMPDGALLAEDVSNAIQYAYGQPRRCNIREISLAPLQQKD